MMTETTAPIPSASPPDEDIFDLSSLLDQIRKAEVEEGGAVLADEEENPEEEGAPEILPRKKGPNSDVTMISEKVREEWANTPWEEGAVNAAPVSSTVPKNEALIAYLADKRKKKPEGQVMNALTAAGIPPSTSEDYVQQLMEGKGRAAKRPKRIASTATGGIKPEEEGKEGETKREAGADSDSKVLSRSKTTRSTAEEPSLSKPSDLESEGSSGVLDNLELDLEEYRRKLAGH